MRYRANISYNGTAYSGWQVQPNAVTVQEKMEEALSKVLNEKVSVMGCGRTDAGVHASYYVLHFNVQSTPHAQTVFRLNQVLPPDIAVHELMEVDPQFHARFDAVSRAYRYRIHTKKDPFSYKRSWYARQLPDLQLLNHCCEILLEYDDFASFCKAGADNQTTLCHLMDAKWESDNGHLQFYIKANRFLRNMVRAVVGTMLDVGYGKVSLDEFRQIIEAKDRKRSGKSAAACGLYLEEVNY